MMTQAVLIPFGKFHATLSVTEFGCKVSWGLAANRKRSPALAPAACAGSTFGLGLKSLQRWEMMRPSVQFVFVCICICDFLPPCMRVTLNTRPAALMQGDSGSELPPRPSPFCSVGSHSRICQASVDASSM